MMSETLHFRILEAKPSKGGKTLRMALVSEIVDSYRTVIPPNGCVSSLASVPVDLNHSRESTECNLIDVGIGEVEVPTNRFDSNGQVITETVQARIVDVFVPENARQWTKQNRNLPPDQVPSLYDDIKNFPNNKFRWGSVDFTPIEIAEIFDQNGAKIREEYPKWRLNFFSLLSTKPGQDTSYILSIRSLNNQTMSEAKTIREGENNPTQAEGSNQPTPPVESTPPTEAGKQRAWLGSAVKSPNGELGVVTAKSEVQTADGESEQYQVTLLNGTVVAVSGEISWDHDDENKNGWKSIDIGQLLIEIIKLLPKPQGTQRSAEENQEPTPTGNDGGDNSETEVAQLKRELDEEKTKTRDLEAKNVKLSETISKLRNSPSEPAETQGEPKTDMQGQGQAAQTESAETRKLEETREEILQRTNPHNYYASTEI